MWFDQNELTGGDAWDKKIRGQISSCALFVPIISANTNARAEGYFRLEWKLAVDRSHLMADDAPFLFPIVIGDVSDATARVPDKFREVQWTRLRLDETPAELAARVCRLLSEEQGARSEEQNNRGQNTEDKAERKRSKRDDRPAWLRYSWSVIGLIFVVYYAMGPIWKPWFRDKAERPASGLPSPVSVVPAARPSEARQLVAKAWEQMNKPEMARAELEAADNLCKRAADLDPTDAEVWAAWSQVESWYVYHRLDSTPVRREGARTKAAQALSLSPQSYEARLAQACYLLREGGGQSATQFTTDAEAGLRALLQERPDEPRALLSLGILQRNLGQIAAFRESFGRMARSPAFAVQAYNELGWAESFLGNYQEAEAAIDASIKLQPYWANLNLKTYLLLFWWGDLDRAKLVADQISVAGSQENYGLSVKLVVNHWRRDPPAMLRVINSVSRDWLQSNAAEGPMAWWTGLAQQMAGQMEVAQLQWEIALKVVEQRLGDQPDSGHLLDWKGRLLLALGRRAEGEASLRLAQAMGFKGNFDDDALSLILLGKEDAAIALLESRVEEKEFLLTAAALRLNPYLAPLRALPRYQALQAKLDADPRYSPKAKPAAAPRDWPKDPQLKQALKLINGFEANTEDYSLAEDLAKTVLERNPMEPEALTVMARVQDAYLYRGFDRSDERQATARRYAERAAQLAPDDPEALAALGIFYFSRSADLVRARELLNRAIELKPTDSLFHRFRDEAMFRDPKFPRDEALASTERTAELFPQDALTLYQLARAYRDLGRLADMEHALDRSIAINPIANAVMWKSRLALWVRGDPAEMRKLVDSVPARTQDLERVVFSRWTHAMAAGLPDEGLAAMRGITTSWFEDFDFTGPRQLLVAQLLELQGKRELARRQYEAALAEVSKQKARDPGNQALPSLETWIFYGLERMEEARSSHRVAIEVVQRPYRYNTLNEWWFTAVPISLLLGEKETALQLIREAVAEASPDGQPRGDVASLARAALRLRFRMDPRMAPFRADPEIVQLLAEPKPGN